MTDTPTTTSTEAFAAGEPVRFIPGDRERRVREGTALCLSGGGYRAMLFHVGVLWRLNEAGLLTQLERISSVSGGSITAGVLAMNWDRLDFDPAGVARAFVPQVVDPVRGLAGVNVDISSVLTGLLLPFTTVSERVADSYQDHLFGNTTLQQIPDEPRFVFNATNLESGVLMRLSKPYLADYRVGRVNDPELPLAVAVAASSAFPPFLSPCTLDLSQAAWVTEPGNDLTGSEFRGEIQLSDGGVYDNLGLETAWKLYSRVLVSDAGGQLSPEADVPSDWARHTVRVLKVVDNQVRALRKGQVIDAFQAGSKEGMYVGIRSDPAAFPVPDPIPTDPAVTRALASIPTRLDALPDDVQEQLINWGYAICDTGLRAHVLPGSAAGHLPYPEHPLVETT